MNVCRVLVYSCLHTCSIPSMHQYTHASMYPSYTHAYHERTLSWRYIALLCYIMKCHTRIHYTTNRPHARPCNYVLLLESLWCHLRSDFDVWILPCVISFFLLYTFRLLFVIFLVSIYCPVWSATAVVRGVLLVELAQSVAHAWAVGKTSYGPFALHENSLLPESLVPDICGCHFLHLRAHTTGESQLAVYVSRCNSVTARLQHASYDHLLAKSIALTSNRWSLTFAAVAVNTGDGARLSGDLPTCG